MAGLLGLLALAGRPADAGAPAARVASPFAGRPLWVDPASAAARHRDDPASPADERAALRVVAARPQASWLGGWVPAARLADVVAATVGPARRAGAVPVLVTYDIPGRDCGAYSAGGATTSTAYRRWVAALATGLRRTAPGPVAVVVEPDALSHLDECGLRPRQRAERLSLLRETVRALAAVPGVAVYLEAGSSGWHTPDDIAARLRAAGVAGARGFALNTSDFKATADVLAFGRRLSGLVGGAPFVVDTSRNGLGALPGPGLDVWCNPPGRALGQAPTTRTGDPAVDAYLWIKTVGESDGECGRGDPPSGRWFGSYVVGLVQRSHLR